MIIKRNILKILILSGIVGIIFYLIHIIIGGLLWKEYSHISNPISDLTASGSPDRSLLLIFIYIYSFLMLIFGVSLLIFCIKLTRKIAFIGSLFFLFMQIISFSYIFFPVDLPGSSPTFTGIMHIVITALIVPVSILTPILIGIGFLKNSLSKSFSFYSILSGVLIFIFGCLTVISLTNHWSIFGLLERLNIGTLQIWCASLSIFVFKKIK